MSLSDSPVLLTVARAGTDAGAGALHLGDRTLELQEDTAYYLRVDVRPTCRLFVDDVELVRASDGAFAWTPNFYAGRVYVTVVETCGREHMFPVDILPADRKLNSDQFHVMVDEIRRFDSRLLLGESSATMEFGKEGRSGFFDGLVQFSRMRQHGPAFLDAVGEILRANHRQLRASMEHVSLARVRRFHPNALKERRFAALATGNLSSETLDSIQLRSQLATLTVDTPANRTLKALIRRFRACALSLLDKTDTLLLGGKQENQLARQARRRHFLVNMVARADGLLECYPFVEVSRVEVTSAGLTQIAALPTYQRAYRKGTDALRLPVEGESARDVQQVCHSWGVFETWCFLQIVALLEKYSGQQLTSTRASAAVADLSFQLSLSTGVHIELLFQAVFPSEAPSHGRQAWTVSAERRPDIVLIATHGLKRSWLVLDAKYRSGRQNVLDAMASAHIYHDGLRVAGSRPALCLLLLPGPTSVPSLEDASFWDEHRVGTISEFSVGGTGLERCANVIAQWVQASAADPVMF